MDTLQDHNHLRVHYSLQAFRLDAQENLCDLYPPGESRMMYELTIDGYPIGRDEYVQPLVAAMNKYARNISFDHAEIRRVDGANQEVYQLRKAGD